MKNTLTLFALITISIPSLSQRYADSVADWDKQRVSELRAPNGWINLAGLFWLAPGDNSFGSDSSNKVIYNMSKFPPQLGTWKWNGDSIYWISRKGVEVKADGQPADSILAWAAGRPVKQEFSFEQYRWMVIQRGDKTGVRFRNLQSPALEQFKGINRFPVDKKWRVKARLIPRPGSTISITNVLGQTTLQPSAGALEFTIGSARYSLEALDEGDGNLFIIFGDETNADQTYASGRFLYVPKPGPTGETYMDFNKAENPPCAFTPFATCPLPPRQNRLSIAVTAGEREVIGLKH